MNERLRRALRQLWNVVLPALTGEAGAARSQHPPDTGGDLGIRLWTR